MEKCRECEPAIYCFCESSSWIFRTKKEMKQKQEAIRNCPLHDEIARLRQAKGRKAW